VEHRDLLPPPTTDEAGRANALDVACGRGRHALWLASLGYRTEAIDRDAGALAILSAEAQCRNLSIDVRRDDLERPDITFGVSAYDVIVAARYLHRPLFPALMAAIRPGGVLVYETFTVAQAARGKPSNPAFLLQPGELVTLVAPLEVLDHRIGDFDGGLMEAIVARRE